MIREGLPKRIMEMGESIRERTRIPRRNWLDQIENIGASRGKSLR